MVLVALAVLSVAVFADDKCAIRTEACMSEGDDCVGDFMINGSEVCKNETKCCAMPLYCIGGTCVEDTRVCFPSNKNVHSPRFFLSF